MRLGHRARHSVMKALFNWHVIPPENVERIEPVDGCQRVQFVQRRNNAAVLNIRQPADMQNEIGTAAARSQFVARSFYISISKSKPFADLPQTKTGKHQSLRSWAHSRPAIPLELPHC